MDQKMFSIVTGVIFAVVALFHLVRIYMGWPVMIGDWSVPMWVSWIGLVVAGGLAFFGFRLCSGRNTLERMVVLTQKQTRVPRRILCRRGKVRPMPPRPRRLLR